MSNYYDFFWCLIWCVMCKKAGSQYLFMTLHNALCCVTSGYFETLLKQQRNAGIEPAAILCIANVA